MDGSPLGIWCIDLEKEKLIVLVFILALPGLGYFFLSWPEIPPRRIPSCKHIGQMFYSCKLGSVSTPGEVGLADKIMIGFGTM